MNITIFKDRDSRMKYRDDKKELACLHGFIFVSEMMFYLFQAGFTPKAIGIFLEITGESVKFHLLKMGCKMRHVGGHHGRLCETGVTGVYPHKKKYASWLYINGKKIYLGLHETIFDASVARRIAELKSGYDWGSTAQEYIDKNWRNNDIFKKAPYTDFAGNDIFEGDKIKHPSGEVGVVIYRKKEKGYHDQWRVLYIDNNGSYGESRLSLQIGYKGMAIVYGGSVGNDM